MFNQNTQLVSSYKQTTRVYIYNIQLVFTSLFFLSPLQPNVTITSFLDNNDQSTAQDQHKQGEYNYNYLTLLYHHSVSRFGLAVRRQVGKRKDLGSIPLRLSFLFEKVVICGHFPVTLSVTSY